MDAEVLEAMADAFEHLASGREGGWSEREPGLLVVHTGAPLPTLNGVVCWREGVEPGRLADALTRVAGTGTPHSLQAAGPARQPARDGAEGLGLARGDDLTLMRLDGPAPTMDLPDVGFRVLGDDEWRVHARLAAQGFEAPLALFEDLTAPIAADPDVLLVVGEQAGAPVTTALGAVGPRAAAVFNVATPPAHRRRGLGVAVTAATVAACRARGAPWTWLQPSELGYGVYRALGFRPVVTVETWLPGAG